MSEPFKCLSLKQPWASLLVHGFKKIETRSWPTSFRGQLYIHASKSDDQIGEALWKQLRSEMFAKLSTPAKDTPFYSLFMPTFEALPRQQIIGHVDVTDCWMMTNDFIIQQGHRELSVGEWKTGRFAWITENQKPINPISAKGSLGIWDYDPVQIDLDRAAAQSKADDERKLRNLQAQARRKLKLKRAMEALEPKQPKLNFNPKPLIVKRRFEL